MRHRDKINHLGRTYSHRKAMLANMACSLILAKRINTTIAKAKELRTFIEPIITATKAVSSIKAQELEAKQTLDKAASDEAKKSAEIAYKTVVAKRTSIQHYVFQRLNDKKATKELVEIVAPKVETRNGGYTRILKTGFRLGDNAKTCMMELVDFNESYNPSKKSAKPAGKTTRRSRKKSSAKTDAPAQSTDNAESKAE